MYNELIPKKLLNDRELYGSFLVSLISHFGIVIIISLMLLKTEQFMITPIEVSLINESAVVGKPKDRITEKRTQHPQKEDLQVKAKQLPDEQETIPDYQAEQLRRQEAIRERDKRLREADLARLKTLTKKTKNLKATSLSELIPEQEYTSKITGESIDIKGPLATRKVIYAYFPVYPDWAREQGIEVEILLKFWVTPQGLVKDVKVMKFSGYSELDRLSLHAMKKWRFEPLPTEVPQRDEWGTIPLKFRLE